MSGGPRWIVVTGTDTGVGKTFVGRALVHALRERAARTIALKPVESGCDELDESEQDGVLLATASGQAAPRHALTRLGAPVAPPVAAELEGVTLNPSRWLREMRNYARPFDVALVEGAGGLLSPLTWELTSLSLAGALDARMLVVAPNKLGTINHTLLTLGAINAGGVQALGVALSDPEELDASSSTNAESLVRCTELPVARVPRAADPATVSSSLESLVDRILANEDA